MGCSTSKAVNAEAPVPPSHNANGQTEADAKSLDVKSALARISQVDDFDWHLNLSDEQKQKLDQLRKRLEQADIIAPTFSDDFVLLRFLKVTWNVEQAFAQYKRMSQWRKDSKVDELFETFDFPEFPQVLQHHPSFYHKQDKFGRPVHVVLYGQLDPAKLLNYSTFDRIFMYKVWMQEHFEKCIVPSVSALVGKPVIQCISIIDLKGFNIKNLTSDNRRASAKVFQLVQDFYPDRIGLTLVINTSKAFKTLWSIAEKLMNDNFKRTVIVLGEDYEDVLKAVIPEDNLPEMFGGKSKMPDDYKSVGAWMDIEPCKSSRNYPDQNA